MSDTGKPEESTRSAHPVSNAVRSVNGALRHAEDAVGRALAAPFQLSALLTGFGRSRQARTPGASPGIDHLAAVAQPPDPATVGIQIMEYGPQTLTEADVHLDALDAALDTPLADTAGVRWINVNGLSPYLVARFKERYGLHTLAAEDVLHIPQRPKTQLYDTQLYVVAHMIRVSDGRLHGEQVSCFLLPGRTLLTFQESEGDIWDPIRERIRAGIGRIRRCGPDYLLYALLDAQIDHGFPLLEGYGDDLEVLEGQIMNSADQEQLARLHHIKHELALLRRLLWPTRDLIDSLQRNEELPIADETRTFLRDVYDHAVQLLDIVEMYREMSTNLRDLYMNAMSQRMNEIMKTLTIMASIFIPMTFIAGVYGMNFEHMPELDKPWGYPAVWLVFIATAGGLLLYFRRKRWF